MHYNHDTKSFTLRPHPQFQTEPHLKHQATVNMSTAGRPQLKGLLRRKLALEVVTAVSLGIAVGSIWYFAVAKPRRQKYDEFYRPMMLQPMQRA